MWIRIPLGKVKGGDGGEGIGCHGGNEAEGGDGWN